MQNNDQKGSLKDTFNNFGVAPTDGLWDAISGKLDEKKKRRFAFWWWSSGLAAVLIIGFTAWNWSQPSGMQSLTGGRQYPVHAETNSKETTIPKGGIAIAAVDSLHLHAPFALIWDPSMFPFNFTLMNGLYNQPFCGNYYGEPWMHNFMMGDNYNNRSNDSLKKTEFVLAKNDSLLSTDSSSPTDSTIHPIEAQQLLLGVILKKWQVGLFAGRSQVFSYSNPLIEGIGTNSNQSLAVNEPVETRYSWDIDLTVSRLISRRWWLGTGVHFGALGSGSIPVTTEIKSGKVNYAALGVPLSIGYELYLGRFTLTPLIGFRYDYAFRKTEEYTYKEPDLSISSADAAPTYVKTTETAKLNLISTSLSAELALRLRRNWNIVAKPTTQFYLYGKTDETNPNTFRKVWFGGSIGVTKRF
jgi:hypothetical protein